VQETVLKSLPHLEKIEYRGEGAVQAYLRGALLNRIRNEYRRVVSRPRPKTVDTAIEQVGPSPLDDAIGRDAAEDYETALAGLDEADRALVILRLELGYGFAEIAAATGRTSPDAARMATSRAILRLAQGMRHGQDRAAGPGPDSRP
jgi:DNA-directed RNA polymerase specialized sigma24 family protein